MNHIQYIIERTNPYANERQFWNGAAWIDEKASALPYADTEAKKLVQKFNKQGNHQFIYRLEKVK